VRVLYVHHVAQLAGAEGSLTLLLRHLDRSRVAPFFAGPAVGPFPDLLRRAGVDVIPVRFGPLRDVVTVMRATGRLRALIRRLDIDLVHSNGPQTNVCAALGARATGIPAVWHVRNLLHGRMRDVDRLLAPLASRLVCNSDAIRERFRGSRAWRKSVTILNAVDLDDFNPGGPAGTLRGELGVDPRDPLVGIVGRIGLGKGHEHFVDAAVALLERGVRAHFVIVGDALFAEDAGRVDALGRRIKAAAAADRIRLTGFRRDVPEVMRSLDVMVLASEAEPCGRVLFEAMACGTAVVGTNTGGTPEIVRDGREGLLVPPRDPAALALAIGRLVADRALRERLGAAGAERARAEFAASTYVRRMVAVYAAVLGRRGETLA
jgi:glycosyltransferase involved in cell wall biosynthesis